MYFYYYSRQYLTTHEPRHVHPPFVRVQFRVGRAPALRTQPFSIKCMNRTSTAPAKLAPAPRCPCRMPAATLTV